MLSKVKYFLLGMLMMSLICIVAIPVYATVNQKSISVVFNNLKLYFNDKPIPLKDTSGNTIQPFTYKNNIYLPINLIAKASGISYYQDTGKSSVYLGAHETNTPKLTINSETTYFNQSNNNTYFFDFIKFSPLEHKDINGKKYTNGLIFKGKGGDRKDTTNTGWREYSLNGKYKKLKCTASVLYDYRTITATKEIINLYGDDQLLYTSNELGSGVMPEDIELDLSGVNKLRIEANFTSVNDGTANIYVLSEIGLLNLNLY